MTVWIDLGRLKDKLRSVTQLFHVGWRHKVTESEVITSNSFGKDFHTLRIYLFTETLLAVIPHGNARTFPWLAVPPSSAAESPETTIHMAFFSQHWQMDCVHGIVLWHCLEGRQSGGVNNVSMFCKHHNGRVSCIDSTSAHPPIFTVDLRAEVGALDNNILEMQESLGCVADTALRNSLSSSHGVTWVTTATYKNLLNRRVHSYYKQSRHNPHAWALMLSSSSRCYKSNMKACQILAQPDWLTWCRKQNLFDIHHC